MAPQCNVTKSFFYSPLIPSISIRANRTNQPAMAAAFPFFFFSFNPTMSSSLSLSAKLRRIRADLDRSSGGQHASPVSSFAVDLPSTSPLLERPLRRRRPASPMTDSVPSSVSSNLTRTRQRILRRDRRRRVAMEAVTTRDTSSLCESSFIHVSVAKTTVPKLSISVDTVAHIESRVDDTTLSLGQLRLLPSPPPIATDDPTDSSPMRLVSTQYKHGTAVGFQVTFEADDVSDCKQPLEPLTTGARSESKTRSSGSRSGISIASVAESRSTGDGRFVLTKEGPVPRHLSAALGFHSLHRSSGDDGDHSRRTPSDSKSEDDDDAVTISSSRVARMRTRKEMFDPRKLPHYSVPTGLSNVLCTVLLCVSSLE